ncbi:MAG: N-acetyl-gamma-glutamyl-phosphate reductase [Candidatus Marinimicrobia bacterium]|nr:N-acetyl-gamma-glutamyl-phosphate reductase [Candidatus Neomarinimicrobiota bacterium]MCF7830016.1 N-acetyl-gamma-glutamyl-phosphate reductase [Candidatus Neomarinimicrobiota bacterium]MCF7881942.1 N-acetyl-gamma-glutamyl-phosphate reductase [Candidatus Neomarinimicrobiota bacterium]
MLDVAIVGGSGYVGGELLRILLDHPECKITQVTSERFSRRSVTTLHPNLRDRTRLRFRSIDQLEKADVLFLCLPHGKAIGDIERFAELADTIIDCSADFRLRDSAWHKEWYDTYTDNPDYRSRFVYGLPELERENLRGARYISGVGCNATATNLALYPLANAGVIESVTVDIKVGSSEGGASASLSSHHPERAGVVRSFAPTGHRHQAEVIQELGLTREQLNFSATAIDMVRGILATSHVFLSEEVSNKDIFGMYRDAYKKEPFIRIIRDRAGVYRFPEPKILAGSNYCDIGWQVDEGSNRVVVVSALDNLMKGAAGSAVQSLNVAHGFDERAGLGFSGLHPV